MSPAPKIDLAKIRKRAAPKEYTGTRLSPETKAWLDAYCADQGVSVHACLEALVEAFRKERACNHQVGGAGVCAKCGRKWERK